MDSEPREINIQQVQVERQKAREESKRRQEERMNEDRKLKNLEKNPQFVKNLCKGKHSDLFHKSLREGEQPHIDYRPWFLPRSKEEIEEKRNAIRKQCIDDKVQTYQKKLMSKRKGMRKNIDKVVGKFEKDISKLEQAKQKLDRKMEELLNKKKEMTSLSSKLTDRLNKETDGFADDNAQLEKYLEHLKKSNPNKLKDVGRLIQRRVVLQEELRQMDDEKLEGGETKYGIISNLRDDNEIEKGELDAKIQELKMQRDEETEKVEEFDDDKIAELVEQKRTELLANYVEPSNNDLRYKFNHSVRLTPKCYQKLHTYKKYAEWNYKDSTENNLVKTFKKENESNLL